MLPDQASGAGAGRAHDLKNYCKGVQSICAVSECESSD